MQASTGSPAVSSRRPTPCTARWRSSLARHRGWVAALVAVAVGLPLGLVAVTWIGLDGWGSYQDGQHLGRLLAEAWVTMLVLAVGCVALGAVVGHHGWLMGLAAWQVV